MKNALRYAGISALLFLLTAACQHPGQKASFEDISAVDALKAHSREFEKRVETVTEGVHVAIGYGLANSVMLEGDDGVIIIDTLESVQTAQKVQAAFRAITDKPVRAVIYTHNHADHVFGASVFADDPEIPIYAHETTSYYMDRIVSVLTPVINRRSMRMFGNRLDDAAIVNAGIGYRLNVHPDSRIGIVRPTRSFADELSDTICGIRFKLIHVPGETNDQICVWLPEKQVLIAADNIYKTFPNLYTIRGTPYRDVRKWVDSLEQMRALGARHLVPCHTGPVSGREKIRELLTVYRDAIAFIHDQTIRGMNKGLAPDELAQKIQLPPHLAEHPYLQEFYGTVEWSVRSIFDGNLGWFDGNPTNLFQLPPKKKAEKMADLAGGEAALLAKAEAGYEKGRYQWVLELTDHLLRLNPENTRVKNLRAGALTALGKAQKNPNARHYYLTCAAELEQDLDMDKRAAPDPEMVHAMPLSTFFDSMAVNLDPQRAADIRQTVHFVFPDIDAAYTVCVRKGVSEITPGRAGHPDITATVDSKAFKEMLARLRSPLVTIAAEFDVKGGKIAFIKFMKLFQASDA
ncbi:MAG: MBL fold metallo-hydrolase [Desulfobacterales bacterium]|nr:MBL fold metallo-hydrolase [Desulfobacterales bacterium]